MALVGCQGERATIEAGEPAVEASAPSARAGLTGMAVEVAHVRADRSINVDAVRTVMHEAEGAFLTCLDPDGSTGVVALKLAITSDGSVGLVSLLPTTTYGTDEARGCMERIVAAMRFPTSHSLEPFELELTLEVRTRYQGE
jgi:hypothetical protein